MRNQRVLVLVCGVPLAVLLLRTFLASPPSNETDALEWRLQEELKSYTAGEGKNGTIRAGNVHGGGGHAKSVEAAAVAACRKLDKAAGPRVECLPSTGTDQRQCWRRGCCWHAGDLSTLWRPICFMPPAYRRYRVVSTLVSSGPSKLVLQHIAPTRLPGESAVLNVEIAKIAYDVVRIRISDESRVEFVPPVPTPSSSPDGYTLVHYSVRLEGEDVLTVTSKDKPNRTLLELNLAHLYYADGQKQITLQTHAGLAYGIRRGPTGETFLNMSQPSRHLFYRAAKSGKDSAHTYTADHPFLVFVDPATGSAHGLFLNNGNQIELVTTPGGAATFRTTGGQLDMFVFSGPAPLEIVQQYQRLFGSPPLASINTLLYPLPSTGPIPLASVVTNEQLASAVNRLALRKLHAKFNVSITSKVVIQSGSGDRPYTCYDERKREVYFMDFTHPMAELHWELMLYYSNISTIVNSSYDFMLLEAPRCRRQGRATPKCPNAAVNGEPTDICGTARMNLSTYGNLKNAYPYLLAEMTHRYDVKMFAERPKLLSDRTYPGQGRWSGYWKAQAPGDWSQLRDTLAEMLTHSMLGIPVYGAAACNLAEVKSTSQAELCLRWFSLSAFFPVHQQMVQARTDLQRRVVAMASKATALRRFLLPYMYLLFLKSSGSGSMFARPTYFDFPGDPKTHRYTSQFMLGPSLLVVPKMSPEEGAVEAYLPAGVWYNWYSSQRVVSTGEAMLVPPPNATAALLTRGGSIIPGWALNTSAGDVHLIVSPDSSDYAYGEMYRDDGVSAGTFEAGRFSLFHFSYMKGILSGHCSACRWPATLRAVTIFGVQGPAPPTRVLLNDRPVKFAFSHSTLYIFDCNHMLRRPYVIIITRL